MLKQVLINVNRNIKRVFYSSRSLTTNTDTQKVLKMNGEEEEIEDLNIDLINHLERTSLLEFGSDEAVVRLKDAVGFAKILFEVNTSGVEPMISVLDDSSLRCRDDIPIDTVRSKILMNSSITEDDYFVSPPGNIPLDRSK